MIWLARNSHTDTIASFQTIQTTNPTPLNTSSPSDLPHQEYLNQQLASPSICSGSRFTATIPSHDYQSFVTDTSQTWLSQPQSPRHLTPATNPISFSDQDSDFVLFPPTATAHAPSTTRRNIGFVPATSHTAPNQRLGQAYNGQQQHHRRRNSTQPLSTSASSLQNLRVSGIIQGNSSLSSSPSMQQFNSPTGQQQRFYANSAPSSTTVLHQQSPRTRPPVPLFSNSTGNINQQNTSTMAFSHGFEGTPSSDGSSSPETELIFPPSDLPSDNMFDFHNDDFASALEPTDGLYDEPLFGTDFESINDSAPAQTPSLDTVSPKDLMVDSMSAPPSGAFTDLTTPGTSAYDSPYMANSTETSPLFAEESFADDPDKWPSLFDPIEKATNIGPVSHFAGANTSPNSVAPKMSRNGSSPGQSSPRSSHQGHHSSISGVGAKRRDKPLPAITVENPNDTVAVKRARNTMAARKSREKRMERTEQLVTEVAHFKAEAEHWKSVAISMGHVE